LEHITFPQLTFSIVQKTNIMQPKGVLPFFLFLLLATPSVAQSHTCGEALMQADQMPAFSGVGLELSEEDRIAFTQRELKRFFHENFEMPKEALRADYSGEVYASFLVAKDGSVATVNLDGSTDYSVGEEVKRVLKSLPLFVPGKDDGEAVCVFLYLDIPFVAGQPVFPQKRLPVFNHSDCAGLSDMELRSCSQMKMLEFVYRNIQYPAEAKAQRVEGTVVVSYVVNEYGFLEDVKVTKGIGYGCDEEAIRVVQQLDDWMPAIIDWEVKSFRMTLPIKFKLN
jgi:TonB family protein